MPPYLPSVPIDYTSLPGTIPPRNQIPQRIRRLLIRRIESIPLSQEFLLPDILKSIQRRQSSIRNRQKCSRGIPGRYIHTRPILINNMSMTIFVWFRSGQWIYHSRRGEAAAARRRGEDGVEDALAAGGDGGDGRHRWGFNGDALRPASDRMQGVFFH